MGFRCAHGAHARCSGDVGHGAVDDRERRVERDRAVERQLGRGGRRRPPRALGRKHGRGAVLRTAVHRAAATTEVERMDTAAAWLLSRMHAGRARIAWR
eukprot:6175716-Pleurochrysis_carterae.AAC.3